MILVIGEALIDLIGSKGSANYQAVVGGANANVALALAVRGEKQAFLGRISSDGFGRMIHSHLSDHGVNLEYSISAEEQTSLAVATIDEKGIASYGFYINGTADWAWQEEELPSVETLNELRVKAIQFGCLGMAIEPGNLVIEKWLRSLKSLPITLSHDLNIRPALGFDRELERIRVERINQISNIIKASDADIEWLYDLPAGASVDEIADSWSRNSLVVITRGSEGVSLFLSGERIDVAGFPVKLVDTVGAGDTFMANFLAELDARSLLEPIKEMDFKNINVIELTEAARFANAAAALVCERTGCQPPTAIETKQRLLS